jgi:hypothetical protein
MAAYFQDSSNETVGVIADSIRGLAERREDVGVVAVSFC